MMKNTCFTFFQAYTILSKSIDKEMWKLREVKTKDVICLCVSAPAWVSLSFKDVSRIAFTDLRFPLKKTERDFNWFRVFKTYA